jgi:uncharacterized protein YjlB
MRGTELRLHQPVPKEEDRSMPILEDTKNIVEKMTGVRRPKPQALAQLVRTRKPNPFRFKDDGETPNNPKWPLVFYRSAIVLSDDYDPAAIIEDLIASNGWTDAWRDGVYDHLHFHTHTHEVLGVARGTAQVQFGGARGRKISLKAGDVIVLPAGTGHRRIKASQDLLVVGAYPASSGKYNEPRPSQADHEQAVKSITKVALPKRDPVYGKDGPLLKLWRK